MPLYEYCCPKCSDSFEGFNRVDDRHEHAPICPRCDEQTELVHSAPATPVLNPARAVKKPHNL